MNLTAKQILRRNPANGGYATPVKTYSVPANENDDKTITVVAQAVYPIDPNVEPIPIRMPCVIQDPTTPANMAVVGPAYQDITGSAVNSLTVRAMQYVSQPGTFLQSPLRTPTIFRSATIPAATGSTDVWTPAAGKKFRLMGYAIHFSGTAAAAGLRTFSIQEETLGDIGINTGTLAPAAGTGAENSVMVVNLPGNGYLATTADKKLQVVTGTTAYNVGADYISVWGTDE